MALASCFGGTAPARWVQRRPYPELPFCEIHVVPRQRERFSESQPRARQREKEGKGSGVASGHRREKPLELVRVHGFYRVAVLGGEAERLRYAITRIGGEMAVFYAYCCERAKNAEDCPHRTDAVVVPEQLLHTLLHRGPLQVAQEQVSKNGRHVMVDVGTIRLDCPQMERRAVQGGEPAGSKVVDRAIHSGHD